MIGRPRRRAPLLGIAADNFYRYGITADLDIRERVDCLWSFLLDQFCA